MRDLIRSGVLVALIVAFIVGGADVRATSLEQLNLADLCARAHQVYRGTIVAVTAGTVEAGGGELPTVTYRIRVDESFHGDFVELKGEKFAEIQMLGDAKPKVGDTVRANRFITDMPSGNVGESYLLFATKPSSIGLSTTVGLGQGWFRITGGRDKEFAVNRYNNRGLFRGMQGDAVSAAAGALPSHGPVPYAQLSDYIRVLLGQ